MGYGSCNKYIQGKWAKCFGYDVVLMVIAETFHVCYLFIECVSCGTQ